MNYQPDRWLIIKIGDIHKLFSVWMGGYLSGDSWRVNSGITKIEFKDDFYSVCGHSGSVYKCHKNYYGTTGYGGSVLHDVVEKSKDLGVEVKILGLSEFEDWFKNYHICKR